MRDALRAVIHLERKVNAPYFIKVVAGEKRVSHVVLVLSGEELDAITPLLRKPYDLAASEED